MKKYILKGILLYTTMFITIIFITGGLEMLVNEGHYILIIISFAVITLLIQLCKHFISYRELYKLTGYHLFYKIYK